MKPLKQITIAIYPPAPIQPLKQTYRAPNGLHWKDGYEDVLLAQISENLEKAYPDVPFRLVPVGRGRYNLCAEENKLWNAKQLQDSPLAVDSSAESSLPTSSPDGSVDANKADIRLVRSMDGGLLGQEESDLVPLPITDDRDSDYIDPRFKETADLILRVS